MVRPQNGSVPDAEERIADLAAAAAIIASIITASLPSALPYHAPAGANCESHDRGGHRGVEAVCPPRHRDFDQQVALGLIIGGEALLLVADQEETRRPIF